ncbi:ABC transporter permease [Natronolimnobius sp. AArcel1]|uniref:ABC transporter permease n=1 Tax=Natronolimnobius sp. AArcel1 TaxID=1679093 RepID=UPI0013EB534E|nr:ABC transporter permease [Natronolimnobius sp. AArcel1]NGM70881.1 ABC transporter permease [Natronolimnobius sp. AArcel1]
MADDSDGTRRGRWNALIGFSLSRLWSRATRTRSGRIAATTAAVALTITLLIVLTGIALALADGGVVSENDATAELEPKGSESVSAVDGVEGPRLGETNERAATISDEDGVDHASPVLVEPVRLENGDGDPQTILMVGVVPDGEPRTVAGLPTDGLEAGDSHYDNGSYTGAPQEEILLSTAAADRLEAADGDELSVAGGEAALPSDMDPAVTVSGVETAGSDGENEAPIALVHLSELQHVSGASDDELADSVLVWGDADAAETAGETAYPNAEIDSPDGVALGSLFDDGLALATGVLALVASIAICASFVATTMGMTVDEDRQTLAVLESVGFPTLSRLVVVALSTLATTAVGALIGVGLGMGAIHVVNAAASATIAPGAVAVVHPLFIPYGIGVALLAGLVAVPYPLAVASRTSVLEEVSQ